MLPILLFSLICLTFTSHFGWLHNPFTAATNGEPADEIPPSPFHPDLIDFWDLTSRALVETKPDCSVPTDPIEAPPLNESASLKKDVDSRPDLLQIPQRDVDIMRDVHAHFVSQIPELARNLPYVNGTQGVVVAASGALLPVFLVSLRMLRRTGSTLPVEVFIESKERYEKEICEIVLPPMNATCMILSEVLEAVPLKLEMSGYQLRALALAFSSFEDVLLLDADNLPLEQPEHLLNAEPFSSKGFVSWPDYVRLFSSTPPTSPLLSPPPSKLTDSIPKGANTASPEYYAITSQPVPPTAERAASEAGQLLLSKRTHAPTVLLTLYYNHYGPSHYYKLLSQQTPTKETEAETDKETYLAAATCLNASFYTVTAGIQTLGYTQAHDKLFVPAGMVQHNPTDDYNRNRRHHNIPANTTNVIRPSFLHANTISPDASKMYSIFTDTLRSQRMWGTREETIAVFGRDVEKQVWAEMLYTGCHLQGAFSAWRNRTDVCRGIGRVYKFLFN